MERIKKKGNQGEVQISEIRRTNKIYEETKITIRTEQGFTRSFRTTKGVRQGCVMSPLLFNIYIYIYGESR